MENKPYSIFSEEFLSAPLDDQSTETLEKLFNNYFVSSYLSKPQFRRKPSPVGPKRKQSTVGEAIELLKERTYMVFYEPLHETSRNFEISIPTGINPDSSRAVFVNIGNHDEATSSFVRRSEQEIFADMLKQILETCRLITFVYGLSRSELESLLEHSKVAVPPKFAEMVRDALSDTAAKIRFDKEIKKIYEKYEDNR